MSVNVLVIPEDFRKDQYVLKPIIQKMMASLGVKARVLVCQEPRLGGVSEALKWQRLQPIIERYKGMTRLFLLIVDRDCDERRRAKLDTLEKHATELLTGSDTVFLAEAAWQEVEVWVLAGLKTLPKKWSWKDVRAHCDPKEAYYDELVRRRGLLDAPYSGRGELTREAARNYPRIRKLCPEDVGRLEERVGDSLGGSA